MIKILLILNLILFFLILAALFFAVGFFIGYIRENKRLYKKITQGKKEPDNAQKAREEKAKREWKKFLNYDGSSNADVVE